MVFFHDLYEVILKNEKPQSCLNIISKYIFCLIKTFKEIYLRTSKQDPDVLQFRANIYELGCLPGNYEKVHRNKLDKKCKYIDKTYNKECEK